MLDAVLFDMDGLMFDTERIGREGWHAAAQILEISIPESVIDAMRGTGIEECRALFNARIPGNLYDTAKKLRTDYADIYIRRNGLPVKPGLLTLLKWLEEQHIPAALATSTGREKAMGYLRMAGVEKYFSDFCFGTEVPRAKPAPDIFLAAAKKLRADPRRCVVLEDSPNGLRAARAAGCRCIVVPDLTPAPKKEENLWDAKAQTLAEVIPILKKLQETPEKIPFAG